jgi:copper chaperone CopZ
MTHQIDLTITGMSCGSCVRHVEEALNALDGVEAHVDLDAGRAAVSSAAPLDVTRLIEAVTEAGYVATAPSQESAR